MSERASLTGVISPLSSHILTFLGLDTVTAGSGLLVGTRDDDDWGQLVASICRAMDDHHAIIWHATDGGHRQRSIQEKVRGLGRYRGLVADTVSLGSFEVSGITLYSDVGWMAPAAHDQLTNLLASSTSHLDTSVAFFRERTVDTAQTWTRLTSGLLWLWMLRAGIRPPVSSARLAPQVIVSFLEDSVQLGGVVLTVVPSEDAGRLLWLVGPEDAVAGASSRLSGIADVAWHPDIHAVTRLWTYAPI